MDRATLESEETSAAGKEMSDIDRRLSELHEFLRRAKAGGSPPVAPAHPVLREDPEPHTVAAGEHAANAVPSREVNGVANDATLLSSAEEFVEDGEGSDEGVGADDKADITVARDVDGVGDVLRSGDTAEMPSL